MSTLEKLRKLHKPVLMAEVMEAFELTGDTFAHSNKRLKIIDATLGLGGHTEELVKKGVSVLGIDADNSMLELASERLEKACPTPEKDFQGSYELVKGNFKNILDIARKNDFVGSDGVLFDLGVSSVQITSGERGFSFQVDEAQLDMRLDRQNMGLKASDLLNILREDQLKEMFAKVLSRRISGDLVREIIYFRKHKKFVSIGDFKKVIGKVIVKKGRKSPETLPFLALRMAVNSELENLRDGLIGALEVLGPEGKIVVISFHSGEDEIAFQMFNTFEKSGQGVQVTKKPITPSQTEIKKNVRSRSALLRVFKKS